MNESIGISGKNRRYSVQTKQYLRIVSGKYKSRRIHLFKEMKLRPTMDKTKESLFNILHNRFDFAEIKALDLFSGTGNISYELSSRGCQNITAVEKEASCIFFIQKIMHDLDIKEINVVRNDVFKFLQNCKESYDFIFADPPYDLPNIYQIPELIFSNNILKKNGWLVIEHSIKSNFNQVRNFVEKRVYGQSTLSFFAYK